MSMDRKQKIRLCKLRGKYMDLHTPEGALALGRRLDKEEQNEPERIGAMLPR